MCFSHCQSLTSVTFDANSRLSRLEKEAFCGSGLQSIHLPGSLEVICGSCFSSCRSLSSVTFDSLSKLKRIERYAFARTALRDLIIPGCVSSFAGSALAGVQLRTLSFSGISMIYSIRDSFVQFLSAQFLIRYLGIEVSVVIDSSVEVIGEACFSSCKSLAFVKFDANSRLSRLEKEAFCGSGLQSINLPGAREGVGVACFSA
jgi:phage protein U